VITAVAGVVAVILACLLAVTPMRSAFDFFQRLLGLTSSGHAGLFILGIFTRRTGSAGALTGAITSAPRSIRGLLPTACPSGRAQVI
jgi:Na+(H+)/acetate symporter ActP